MPEDRRYRKSDVRNCLRGWGLKKTQLTVYRKWGDERSAVLFSLFACICLLIIGIGRATEENG